MFNQGMIIMQKVKLGNTGLMVSRLCFGALTVSPLQAKLSIEEGARVMAYAFDKGVNFIDTAKLYENYPYIKRALELTKNKDIVISCKSYDYTYEGMKESVSEACEAMGVKKIHIFSLHEQESRLTLKGHRDAIRYLQDAQKQGIIDAIGVSTHSIEVVDAIADMPEVQVVHPLYNKNGLGIMDGSVEEMGLAIKKANLAGKGIYSMKALGGGNLLSSYKECVDFVLSNPYIHSIAMGMQTIDEVDADMAAIEGRPVSDELLKRVKERSKRLLIEEWCEGCGHCVDACQSKALSLMNGKAQVDKSKCLLCGYCSAHCPNFYIKIV